MKWSQLEALTNINITEEEENKEEETELTSSYLAFTTDFYKVKFLITRK